MFKPGQSGNPGGRPKGTKLKLQGDFMRALADDFAAHGIGAIVKVREEKPSDYLKVIASLMPKEVEVTRPLEELSDDDLATAVDYLRAKAAESAGSGAANTIGAEPPAGLQTLQ